MKDETCAFPVKDINETNVFGSTGLTKRELFAAMAMQGLLASPTPVVTMQRACELAVATADALLAELNK